MVFGLAAAVVTAVPLFFKYPGEYRETQKTTTAPCLARLLGAAGFAFVTVFAQAAGFLINLSKRNCVGYRSGYCVQSKNMRQSLVFTT